MGYSQKLFDSKEKWLVPFSHSVLSDSLGPHGLQHARPPCPLPTPGACSDSRLSSWWCHPTISSSVISFCLQSFPASGSFPMSQFFVSGGQTLGIPASPLVLLVNTQDWYSENQWKMMEALYFTVHCTCWLLWYTFPLWLNLVISPQMGCSLSSVTCFYLSKKTDTLDIVVFNKFITVVR